MPDSTSAHPDSDDGLHASERAAEDGEPCATQLFSDHRNSATAPSDLLQDTSGRFIFPVPGKKLGKYQIESILGQGGMGIVFDAWDPDLCRRVAIKVLGPQLALSLTARRRFLREARAAASINHANVLTIHAVEQHEDVPYLVMELVTGQTLKSYVAKKGALDSVEVIRICHQIALGLAAAHSQGVIHRDVKPGNVMLDESGTRVWLTDFGLARAALDNVELTSDGHAVGTPAYMSPEQVRGTPLDVRSDLFGFGCLIYYMFTGQSPFQGRVTSETWNRILTEDPLPLTAIQPSMPPLLSEIASRLLEKDPNDRCQTATEVAEELEQFLIVLNQAASNEIGLLLKRSHIRRRGWRWKSAISRRSGWIAGGGMAALLLLLTITPIGEQSAISRLRLLGPTATPVSSANSQTTLKLNAIRVGTDAQSDCATITEALKLAAQPCVITVTGPGPYYEGVKIVGAAFDQLQLIAESPVAWGCPSDGSHHPLSIADVRGVTVRGFDFQIQLPEARAIEVTDHAEDILIQRCRFAHQAASPRLSLLWIATDSPDWDNRVTIDDCHFHALGRTSFCVSISAGMGQGSQVEFSNCRFRALTTHLYATETCRRLQVTGCLFIGGNNAINLSLKRSDRQYPFAIENNTFVGVKYWLGLMDSFRLGMQATEPMGGNIVNNLILGGQRVQGGEDQLQYLIKNWQVAANWWERDEGTRSDAGHNGQIAHVVSRVELLDRNDESSSDYLVPAAGSALASSGFGGDLPVYVGAFAPSLK
jgi:eukaryotic-like serine/threonine-protein kinase